MISEITKSAEQHMQKSIVNLQTELSKVRTGRAQPGLLEHIQVSCYGNMMPLNQVASITVGDARTLVVTPWDKNMVAPVEKAIMQSDLGLNPATAGQVIRVPLPALTEERRKELIKLVKSEVENARVAIRNIRRDANTHIKNLLKEKSISEDDERRAQDNIQSLTDKYISEADKLLSQKETELLEV